MYNTAKFFTAIALMSSTGAMAGNGTTPLGDPTVSLGITSPALGTDLSLPILAGIAVIGLIAGVRYIRNKRS